MLQIIVFLIALLLDPATVARTDTNYCGHASHGAVSLATIWCDLPDFASVESACGS